MIEKLIKALEEAADANVKLCEAYEGVMVEASRTKDENVYQYYKQLRFELIDAVQTIDNEIHKLKG